MGGKYYAEALLVTVFSCSSLYSGRGSFSTTCVLGTGAQILLGQTEPYLYGF